MHLMEEYPDARQYYFSVAFERRTEIRRRMKRFCHQLEKKRILTKLLNNAPEHTSDYWHSENNSQSSDEFDDA